jgi:hypothetical protein
MGSNALSNEAGSDGEVAATIKLGTGPDSAFNSAADPATIVEVTKTKFLNTSTINAELIVRANNNNDDVAAAIIEVRRPNEMLSSQVDDGMGNPVTVQQTADGYVRRLLGPEGTCASAPNFYCLNYGDPLIPDPDQFDAPGTYEIYYYVEDTETGDLSPQERSVVYKALGGNDAPSAPTLVSPADGDIDIPLVAALDWTDSVDPEGNALTYTVRVATDSAMANVIYKEEEIPFSFHVVPPASGLANDTDYWWDVQAIDFYGATVDSICDGAPSTPCMFHTVESGNNNTGLIRGVIRGLTQSNAVVTQLNNAAVGQNNGTPEQVIVHYDSVYDLTVYSVETLAGTIQLQATADSFDLKQKNSIELAVNETIDNENFLLDETPDLDADGVLDEFDNCTVVPNGPTIPDAGGNIQLDSNGDNYGNLCDADLNNDGVVNGLDVGPFVSQFGTAGPDADFNGDGIVNGLDVGPFVNSFGQSPGPSGLAP